MPTKEERLYTQSRYKRRKRRRRKKYSYQTLSQFDEAPGAHLAVQPRKSTVATASASAGALLQRRQGSCWVLFPVPPCCGSEVGGGGERA